METDRNLLSGVLAMQADLITQDQFVQACTLWTTRKEAHHKKRKAGQGGETGTSYP
jgi:hypothetical protein